jgi:putative hemolysin
MAIVLFEDSTVAGLVTIEDLVEELVGEIFSEYDKPTELVRPERDGSFVIQGMTPIRDANRMLPFELPAGDEYATVAGLCSHVAGEIPQTGRTIPLSDGVSLEIVDATMRRVRWVRVWQHGNDAQGQDAPAAHAHAADQIE